jgi:hypothetical protein
MSIYTQLVTDDIVEANPTVITTGLWTGDTGSFESTLYLATDTGQQANISGEYYLDVYDKDPTSDTLAEVQFAVAYGHINGAGAPTLTENEQATLPTKAIYSQYKNLLLNPTDSRFTFQGVASDHVYIINFQRARIREQLDPGNWELPMSGANGLFTFIDDSNQTIALTANSKAGRVYNIVSGTLSSTSGSVTASGGTTFGITGGPGYGTVYPDLGIMVLNPNAIGPMVGFYASGSLQRTITGSALTSSIQTPFYTLGTGLNTSIVPYAPLIHALTETSWSGKLAAYNHDAVFVSIKLATGAGGYDKGFRARSAETISSTHYFVRLRNKDYNYSNNPTFYNPTNGALVQSDFKNNPKVYVTTVGLYNDQNELLAVAKLSKPVRKSFDEEILLRVRLDF